MEHDRLSEREVRSLYERHGKALTLYARSFGLDFASAQDAVQQVFLKLLSGCANVPQVTPGYLRASNPSSPPSTPATPFISK